MEEKNIDSGNGIEKKKNDLITRDDKTVYSSEIFGRRDPSEGIAFAPDDEDDRQLPVEEQEGAERELSFYSVGDGETGEGDGEGRNQNRADGKKQRVRKRKRVITEHGGSVRSITFTVAYISGIIVAGVVMAYFIIAFMNDVFAFSKDKSVVEFSVDSNITVDQLADKLHDEGIINYPFVFKIYVALKFDNEISVKTGTYNISASFNYEKLLSVLNPAPERSVITLTFPEGITTDGVIEIFVSNGIGTYEGFADVIENYDFDYWFLEDLEASEDRYYRLDGYLYPDTYKFYSDLSEEAALKKLLSNFNKKFGKTYMTRVDELGMTLDQVVTLASMIQAETVKTSDCIFVSAVFHNRLNDPVYAGALESDATIQYILSHEFGGRHEKLTAEDLLIDSPYNTRLYNGFPPGPICNPSLNALKAAIFPDEDCGYYYFVTGNDNYCLFAKTYNEHLANIETVKKEAEDNAQNP